MLARSVLQHRWAISPRDTDAPAWINAAHREWEARRMGVYAAMIDRMDQQIGRVLEALRRLGQYDDTLGASAFLIWLPRNGHTNRISHESNLARVIRALRGGSA
jgi:hypothetical protein